VRYWPKSFARQSGPESPELENPTANDRQRLSVMQGGASGLKERLKGASRQERIRGTKGPSDRANGPAAREQKPTWNDGTGTLRPTDPQTHKYRRVLSEVWTCVEPPS
jgi:hypothetical protein